jgi:hypothetical protein
MKERPVDLDRAIVAHIQTPVIPQPADGAFHNPTQPVSSRRGS